MEGGGKKVSGSCSDGMEGAHHQRVWGGEAVEGGGEKVSGRCFNGIKAHDECLTACYVPLCL